MPDKNGNYSEEEKKKLSESYSKIDVWRDGKKITEDGVIIDDKIKSTHGTTRKISAKSSYIMFLPSRIPTVKELILAMNPSLLKRLLK